MSITLRFFKSFFYYSILSQIPSSEADYWLEQILAMHDTSLGVCHKAQPTLQPLPSHPPSEHLSVGTILSLPPPIHPLGVEDNPRHDEGRQRFAHVSSPNARIAG